nr:putative odorant receptor 69a [Drosophila kikkawai]
MQFNDYMKYLDKGCGIAFAPRYQWTGRPAIKSNHKCFKKGIFLLGAVLLGYQNIGVIIYWYIYGRTVKDTKSFVAELSEMCGYLMLTFVGIGNILTFTLNRPQIEVAFKNLQDLYPRPGQRHYRCQHYFDLPLFLMKLQYWFYVMFLVYYNGFPILLLVWEYLTEAKTLSYRAQTKAWYPWKIYGSAIGYSASLCCQALGCLIGVGMSLAALNIVSVFTFQLKLHYDAMASQLLSLDSRHPKAHKKLKSLIAYHCRILQLGEQFNHILNFYFVATLIGSTIAICMTSVAVLLLDLASAFKAILGIVAFVLYHFVICYMGTEVNLALVGRKAEGTAGFVAEISEAAGAMMLTSIGICNIWALTYYRTEIEEVLTELKELYPRPKEMHYRQQHYFELANRFMKYEFIFYWAFCDHPSVL